MAPIVGPLCERAAEIAIPIPTPIPFPITIPVFAMLNAKCIFRYARTTLALTFPALAIALRVSTTSRACSPISP